MRLLYYLPFLICTSLRALTGGRGTPLSGSWIMLIRMSIVMSLSVIDDTLALSKAPPPINAALRGSTFFFFFFRRTLVGRGVASSGVVDFDWSSSLESSMDKPRVHIKREGVSDSSVAPETAVARVHDLYY